MRDNYLIIPYSKDDHRYTHTAYNMRIKYIINWRERSPLELGVDVGWVAVDKDGRRDDGDPGIAADNLGGVLVDWVGVVVGAKFQVVGLAGCRRDLLSQTGVSGAELPDDHEDAEDDEDEHEPTESQDSGPVRGHIVGDDFELLANGRDEVIINPKERTPNHTTADDVKISFPSPAQPVGIEHL